MTPDQRKPDPKSVLQELTNAAHPYGLRVVLEPQMPIPDLVFLRPRDGAEIARLRYDDPPGRDPSLRVFFPPHVGESEGQEVVAHLAEHLAPVIQRRFTYAMWMRLVDGERPVPGARLSG